MNEEDQNIEVASTEPKHKELFAELDDAITRAAWYYQRCQEAYETRFCVWDGQSDDGRKHEEDMGELPFPWEGSSDTRVRTADNIVRYRVRIMKAVYSRGRIQSMPTELDDTPDMNVPATILQWLSRTHMLKSGRKAVEQAAQWRETYGASVMGHFWDRQTRLEMKQISLQALLEMVMAMPNGPQKDQSLAMLNWVLDPQQEDAAAEMLRKMAAGLTKAEARKVIVDLRETGMAEYPQAYVFKNQPVRRAMRPFVHVFFPVETADFEHVRWMACPEYLTETELRDMINSDDWDEAFVEECLNHKGKITSQTVLQQTLQSNELSGQQTIGVTKQEGDYKDRIEIWRFYYLAIRHGSPVLCTTILHRQVCELFAKHEENEHSHGQFPFREYVAEWSADTILESRGVAHVEKSRQEEIKRQRDYRADRCSLAIQPAMRVPSNRGKLSVLISPRANIPERRSGEIGYFDQLPVEQGTIEYERAVKRDIDEYWGVQSPEVDPNLVVAVQQELADDFAAELSASYQLEWQLCQQYYDEAEVSRIVGAIQRKPVHVPKEEIQGKYDISVMFDVRDLNMEFLGKKMDLFAKVLIPLDSVGAIDRAGLIFDIANAIDPQLAQRHVKSMASATQSEISDENNAWSQIMSGAEPQLEEKGQNFQLRMQVLKGLLQSNPDVPQRVAQNPRIGQILENRMKHFEFALAQAQNAQIGRMGVAPTPMGIGQVA